VIKKIITFAFLFCFFNFLISQPITKTISAMTIITQSPAKELIAKKFPEVILKTKEGSSYTGKILSIFGEKIKFSPSPYWNVEVLEISLDNIDSIKLPKKSSKALKGASYGFGVTFLTIGTVASLTCKYNEDFEDGLLASAVLGGMAGVLGFVIGGLSDWRTKSEYDFSKMSNPEKIKAVHKLIGY